MEQIGLIEAPVQSLILSHSLCGDSRGSLYMGHLNPDPMVTKLERIE